MIVQVRSRNETNCSREQNTTATSIPLKIFNYVSIVRLLFGHYNHWLATTKRQRLLLKFYCLLYITLIIFITAITSQGVFGKMAIGCAVELSVYHFTALIVDISPLEYFLNVLSHCNSPASGKFLLRTMLLQIIISALQVLPLVTIGLGLICVSEANECSENIWLMVLAGWLLCALHVNLFCRNFSFLLLFCAINSILIGIKNIGDETHNSGRQCTDYVKTFTEIRENYKKVESFLKKSVYFSFFCVTIMLLVAVKTIVERSIDKELTNTLVARQIFFLFYILFNISVPILIIECIKVTEQKIFKHVSDLQSTLTDERVRSDLKRMVKYIRMCPIRLTVWGVVHVDIGLLIGLISFALNYSIAFVQLLLAGTNNYN